MQPIIISTIVPLLNTNKTLFSRAIEGVSVEHFRERPGANSNPMAWIAGHLVVSRSGMARIAGATVEPQSWAKQFGRGASVDDIITYPSSEELESEWNVVSDTLTGRLEELNDQDLDGPSPFNVPAGEKNVRGALAFLQYHETYHIGQLSYVRRQFGYGQLMG